MPSSVFWAVVLVEFLSSCSSIHLPLNEDGRRSQTKSVKELLQEVLEAHHKTDLHRGPLSKDYQPSLGYEPYWQGGDWVFDREQPQPLLPNTTESGMCGNECSSVYKQYGAICARNKIFDYKDFDDYCQMKNQDCSGGKVHVCIGNDEEMDIKSKFVSSLMNLMPAATVDPLVDPGDHYDPNYGYEPYWPGGEWKIRDAWEWDKSNATTTPIPTICGDECSYLYASLGEVCAHQMGDGYYYKCLAEICGEKEIMMDISGGFITFRSYCAYLDAQCKAQPYQRWGLVHLGPCITNQGHIYKPNTLSKYSMNRMKAYLSTLKARMVQLDRDVDVY